MVAGRLAKRRPGTAPQVRPIAGVRAEYTAAHALRHRPTVTPGREAGSGLGRVSEASVPAARGSPGCPGDPRIIIVNGIRGSPPCSATCGPPCSGNPWSPPCSSNP